MTLAERLEAYLTRTHGQPASVKMLSRISGGASRETYKFDAEIAGETLGYILRRDPPAA